MAIVNKNHPDIINSQSGNGITYVTIKDNEFYFTTEAVRRFGLKEGKYLHFDNDGRSWCFFQNDDPDGFKLQSHDSDVSVALRVKSIALVRLFLKTTGFKDTTRLALTKLNAQVNGFNMVEINTVKTYDELVKERPRQISSKHVRPIGSGAQPYKFAWGG